MSMHLQAATKYDPNVIIQAAADKVSKNDIPGAQMVYQAALLEWVDDAREGSTSGVDPYTVREAIATLWLSYANLSRTLGLNKSAMEAYEQAINDPVAKSVGRVWLDYARFAEERDKLRTAQNVYLRALVGDGNNPAAITDEQDQALLWGEFLEMMKKSNSALTMSELKTAVQTEHIAKMAAQAEGAKTAVNQPEVVASSATLPGNEVPADEPDVSSYEPPEKRARTDDVPLVTTSAVPVQMQQMQHQQHQQQQQQQQQQKEESKTYVITAEAVEDDTKALNSLIATMPPEYSAAWLARDGDSPPLPPSPALFTASPPKLADPTGKAILGEKLALALITMLLKKDDNDKCGSVLLDVCRGLWLMTGLKEKESAKAIENLEKEMTKELETVESRFEARLANYTGPALSSMQQVNANERDAFIQSCNQRRQQLLAMIAWDFRHLQCTQQQILSKMKVPGFQGPTVDPSALELQSRICSFLHSAFYLRSRIKEVPHLTMLKSQAERLRTSINEDTTPPTIASPPVPVPTLGAPQAPPPLPSTTGGPLPPPQYPPPPPPHAPPPPPLPVNLPPPHPIYAQPGQPFIPGYPPGIPPPPLPSGGQQPPPPPPQYGQQQFYR